jgi:hypothetical protein
MWSILFPLSIITVFCTYKWINRYQSHEIELEDLNTLYQCTCCGKFHRKYQEELHSLIEPDVSLPSTCPNCHQPAQLYTGEQFEWMKTNPDCPELNKRDLRKIKKVMKTLKRLTSESRSLDTFLQYYLPNNDSPDRKEDMK